MRQSQRAGARKTPTGGGRRWDAGLPSLLLSLTALQQACLAAEASAPTETGQSQLKAIVETRDIGDVVLSPDRTRIAFRLISPNVSTNEIAATWCVLSLVAESNLRALDDTGPPLEVWAVLFPDPPEWSADSRWIYYRKAGSSGVQIWRARADGSAAAERISDDPADVAGFRLAPDGQQLLYEVRATRDAIDRAEERERRDGVLIDLTVKPLYEVSGTVPLDGRLGLIRSFAEVGRTNILGNTPTRVRVVDIASREVHEATRVEILQYEDLKAVPDPEHALLTTSPEKRARAYLSPVGERAVDFLMRPAPYRYRITWESSDGKSKDVCRADVCLGTLETLRGLAWTNDGQEVVFVGEGGTDDTRAKLYGWRPGGGRVRKIFDSQGQLTTVDRYGSSVCPIAGPEAICVLSSPASPPRLVAIALRGGRARTLYDPNPQLRAVTYTRIEHLTWITSEAKSRSGWLAYPSDFKTGERHPLVITSAWCDGFLRGGTGDTTPEHVIAAHGMFALCTQGDRFVTYPREAFHSSVWTDGVILDNKRELDSWHAAIELLNSRGLIDRSRVGVSGLSFGSLSASYAISHSDDFAAAATAAGGDLDPWVWYFFPSPGDRYRFIDEHLRGLTSPFEKFEQWRAVSPALNATRVHAPLLIQASDNEFRSSLMFYSNLVELKKPVEMIVYPGEGHQFHQPVHSLVVKERNLDWFRYWLQNYVDPDPPKQPQYVRWRALRAQHEADAARLQGP